jgi:hypothetical protein
MCFQALRALKERPMTESYEASRTLTHEELPRLHDVTEEISRFCRAQLRASLDALAPLFRPRRVIGNHMEGPGKESIIGADQNFKDLREIYFKACGRPFELRKELSTPLESVPTQIQTYEWEYDYEISSEKQSRTINVVSPLTWVLAYPSTYTYSMVRQVVPAKHERDTEGVRSFVLRASLMHLLFLKLPELKTLLEGLRYKVEVRTSPELGELPLVTISAPVSTIRPADDVLTRAAGFAGRPGFVEVIDPEQAARILDPLQAEVKRILNASDGASTVS